MMEILIDTLLLVERRTVHLDRAMLVAGVFSLSIAVAGTLTLHV